MKKLPDRKHVLSDVSGFTLVEVLIALTIFSIGLLALAGMQITGIKGNSTAQVITAKVSLADAVIEEILALDGDDPLLGTDANNVPWEIWQTDTSVALQGAGTCSATIDIDADPDIDGPHPGLTKVDVTVTGNSGLDVVKTIMKRRY